MLHRLVEYINTTLSFRHFGYVSQSDSVDIIHPQLYADASFGDDQKSSKSTSGAYLVMQNRHEKGTAPSTNFPITGTSTSQSCIAHSTPEAEIVSLDSALNKIVVGTFSLYNTILQGSVEKGNTTKTTVHEDNTATIQVCNTCRNPTMKTLARNFGISIGSLHHTFQNKAAYELVYEDSGTMCADIFTKGFTDYSK